MLQNWLKPLTATFFKTVEHLPAHSLGQHLLTFRDQLPELKKVRVALIGLDDKEANIIRQALYRTTNTFPEGAIADLGNLRKPDAAQIIPVVYELLSGQVIPVLIGGPGRLAPAQFLAYQEAKALANLVVVDERPRLSLDKKSPDVYDSLLSPRHPLLFHYELIGYQLHQTPPAVLDFFQKNYFDAARLGKTRAALEETEPLIRDADLMCFHLGALKQSEAPGVAQASPSGYFLEEACQLCRYAGMSDKLTSFGVYDFQHALDREAQTAQAAALLVWYFLDGVFGRKGDYPASKDGLTEYIVDSRKHHFQLTFWRSNRTGRWWMQVPVNEKRKYQRHRLIPCSYLDYQAACREELPERLFYALKRFG